MNYRNFMENFFVEIIKFLQIRFKSEKFRNKSDFVLLIGINLFIPLFYGSYFFFILMQNMLIISLGAVTLPFNINELVYYWEYFFLDFIYFFFLVLRFFLLPFTYNFLEKKSQNEIVKNFIYKLKNNKKARYSILLISEILFVFFYVFYKFIFNNMPNLFAYDIKYLNSIICIHIQFTLFSDLLGSYLVLFLWWKFKGELK